MKYFMIVLVLIGFVGLTIPQSFALNQEQGDSKIAYEFVLDDCINPSDFAVGYVFENATHYMDNTDCILYEKRMIKGSDNELAEKRVLDNFPNFLKSPLKQVNSGIPSWDVKCNKDLVLIQKYDGTPACVTPQTTTKLTDRTDQKSWIPSEQLWENLGKQIHSAFNPTACPRICITMEPIDSMEEAVKKTNFKVDLPRYIPENYDFFKFFSQESVLSIQILPKPLPENLTWSEFYFMDKGIFLQYVNNPITIDGEAQVAHWAKNHGAQNLSLSNGEPIFVRERSLVFDADLQMLVLNYPSEAQFNISKDITVVLVGYVSQEEIIAMANSFFNEN